MSLDRQFPTRRGSRIRYLCRTCERTFVPSLGTPYHRLRRPRRDYDQFPGQVLVTADQFKCRLLSSSPRLVLGTPADLERALARCEDSKKPNTAYIERLNLFLRRARSYLHRRTPGKMRKPARLENALEILRLYYNFIRPHSSLRFGKVTRTPAMQAGLFDRPLTFREVFSWVPPPAVVLPRLVEFR